MKRTAEDRSASCMEKKHEKESAKNQQYNRQAKKKEERPINCKCGPHSTDRRLSLAIRKYQNDKPVHSSSMKPAGRWRIFFQQFIFLALQYQDVTG